MPEVIPLPAMRRLWKVRFGDSLDLPKVATNILIRAQTAFDAMTRAKKTEGWRAFQGVHKEAEIVGVEFAGHIES